VTNLTTFAQVVSHEIGHTFGLDDSLTCLPNTSAMTLPHTSDLSEGGGHDGPTDCDSCAVKNNYAGLPMSTACSPTPSLTPPPYIPPAGLCGAQPDYDTYPAGCTPGFVYSGGVCTRSAAFQNQCNRFGSYDDLSCSCSGGCAVDGSCSPIVIDTAGNGFDLTDSANGVEFDLRGFGVPERIGWTTVNSDDGWLVMDRDGNGVIDNGMELFGTATPQPSSPQRNGFLALAEYDKIPNGGNGDGIISKWDTVWPKLRIWLDSNHNGISEPGELHTLDSLGLTKLDLDYKESRRVDQFGNQFKWRAKAKDENDTQVGRWAWDVIPVHQ
jgi:hypothetical protein